ncbi:MAG TPA: PQQ-binding-like beta-propeller repeat protein, partial [Gammaproteobacteria bacterium]|nr:PQQ-binding-like beta-propeller repeat protein [Gammaproteobacteria bacterium]
RLASRRVLAVGQKSGMLHALDPDQHGEILWQARAGQGGRIGGIQWGSATDGKVIYVAVSDMSFTEETATGTKPDPTRGGGMFAFRAVDGKRIWMSAPPACGDRSPCSPAQSGAVSAMPGIVFSGSYDGHFRAYDTHNGKIVFDFDTVREYKTVNGVHAKGGALDAGGPVIANGRVFVNSGYARWGGIPGNVVLAFGAD